MCYTKRTTSPYFNTWDHHHQANSLGIEFHYQLDQFAIGLQSQQNAICKSTMMVQGEEFC